MNSRTKLWVAVYLAITLLGAATVLANTIYFPVIVKSPTLTPTATFAATPTLTRTPSITATPTRTPTPPKVEIIDIVYAPVPEIDEYVVIENNSKNSLNMDGWWVKAVSSGERYDFKNFTLGGEKTVRLWTRIGQDTTSNLYWGLTTPVWKDNEDCAYLRNETGIIDTYCYGYDAQDQFPVQIIP